MSEWRSFKSELRAPASDAAGAPHHVSADGARRPDRGIGVGMVLAAFLFMKRMAEVTNVTASRASSKTRRRSPDESGAHLSPRRSPRTSRSTRSTARSSSGRPRRSRTPCREIARKPGCSSSACATCRPSTRPQCPHLRDLVRVTGDGTGRNPLRCPRPADSRAAALRR